MLNICILNFDVLNWLSRYIRPFSAHHPSKLRTMISNRKHCLSLQIKAFLPSVRSRKLCGGAHLELQQSSDRSKISKTNLLFDFEHPSWQQCQRQMKSSSVCTMLYLPEIHTEHLYRRFGLRWDVMVTIDFDTVFHNPRDLQQAKMKIQWMNQTHRERERVRKGESSVILVLMFCVQVTELRFNL